MSLIETHLTPLLASSTGERFGESLARAVLERGSVRRVSTDSMLFQEGDEAHAVYLVSRGVIKLVRYTSDGREVILHLAEPYRMIAEAALFLGRYPASAVATEPAEVIVLRREDVDALMDTHPVFMRLIVNAMAGWMKRLVDKIDQLTLNDAAARLAHYLLGSLTSESQDGRLHSTVHLPVKKGELARLLNMNQATLSRALRRLQDDEVLAVRGRDVTVLDAIGLQSASMPPLDP